MESSVSVLLVRLHFLQHLIYFQSAHLRPVSLAPCPSRCFGRCSSHRGDYRAPVIFLAATALPVSTAGQKPSAASPHAQFPSVPPNAVRQQFYRKATCSAIATEEDRTPDDKLIQNGSFSVPASAPHQWLASAIENEAGNLSIESLLSEKSMEETKTSFAERRMWTTLPVREAASGENPPATGPTRIRSVSAEVLNGKHSAFAETSAPCVSTPCSESSGYFLLESGLQQHLQAESYSSEIIKNDDRSTQSDSSAPELRKATNLRDLGNEEHPWQPHSDKQGGSLEVSTTIFDSQMIPSVRRVRAAFEKFVIGETAEASGQKCHKPAGGNIAQKVSSFSVYLEEGGLAGHSRAQRASLLPPGAHMLRRLQSRGPEKRSPHKQALMQSVKSSSGGMDFTLEKQRKKSLASRSDEHHLAELKSAGSSLSFEDRRRRFDSSFSRVLHRRKYRLDAARFPYQPIFDSPVIGETARFAAAAASLIPLAVAAASVRRMAQVNAEQQQLEIGRLGEERQRLEERLLQLQKEQHEREEKPHSAAVRQDTTRSEDSEHEVQALQTEVETLSLPSSIINEFFNAIRSVLTSAASFSADVSEVAVDQYHEFIDSPAVQGIEGIVDVAACPLTRWAWWFFSSLYRMIIYAGGLVISTSFLSVPRGARLLAQIVNLALWWLWDMRKVIYIMRQAMYAGARVLRVSQLWRLIQAKFSVFVVLVWTCLSKFAAFLMANPSWMLSLLLISLRPPPEGLTLTALVLVLNWLPNGFLEFMPVALRSVLITLGQHFREAQMPPHLTDFKPANRVCAIAVLPALYLLRVAILLWRDFTEIPSFVAVGLKSLLTTVAVSLGDLGGRFAAVVERGRQLPVFLALQEIGFTNLVKASLTTLSWELMWLIYVFPPLLVNSVVKQFRSARSTRVESPLDEAGDNNEDNNNNDDVNGASNSPFTGEQRRQSSPRDQNSSRGRPEPSPKGPLLKGRAGGGRGLLPTPGFGPTDQAGASVTGQPRGSAAPQATSIPFVHTGGLTGNQPASPQSRDVAGSKSTQTRAAQSQSPTRRAWNLSLPSFFGFARASAAFSSGRTSRVTSSSTSALRNTSVFTAQEDLFGFVYPTPRQQQIAREQALQEEAAEAVRREREAERKEARRQALIEVQKERIKQEEQQRADETGRQAARAVRHGPFSVLSLSRD